MGAFLGQTCFLGKAFSLESKRSGECRHWERRSRIGNSSPSGTSSGTLSLPWEATFGLVENRRHLAGIGSNRSRSCWGGSGRRLRKYSPLKSRTPYTESFAIGKIVTFGITCLKLMLCHGALSGMDGVV